MSTKRKITVTPTGKQAGTERSSTESLRRKLDNVIGLVSDDPNDAKRFADTLKTLAHQICSLHLQQKALFGFGTEFPGPSPDTYFSVESYAAEESLGALEREIHAGIKRQRTLIADLELRATLLQAKLRFKGAFVPRG
jgi:hypothetical protein